MTLFVAFISPFGGFLVTALKKALRPKDRNRFKGGVIDRLDCILIVGLFMLIFVTKIISQEKTPE